ncbi:MAG: endopeptidase La [Candidatus Zixiibacteriota bacterium]
MIIRSKNRIPQVGADIEAEYSVLPLMTGVLMPGMTMAVQIGRPENLQLVDQVITDKKEFVASYSHAEIDTATSAPIHQVGVLARIVDVREGPGGSRMVTLEGTKRVSINRIVSTEPFIRAVASTVETPAYVRRNIQPKVDNAIAIASEITHLDPIYSPEVSNVLKMNIEDPSALADRVASTFHFPLAAKQELLETIPLELRFDRLLYYLNNELNRVATLLNINQHVKKRIEDEQQRYYLRQQLYEIKRQLGEEYTEEKEAARFRHMIKSSPQLPSEVIARAKLEIDRLSELSPASAEYGATKGYLDWILNLPWGKNSTEDYQIADVERILSTDYYGPTSLKEQLMQRLSVRKLMGGVDEGPTLCLVGAPGTGKASIAKAIARALGKEFVRISVGGIGDVNELKGAPRTWWGAFPGKIVRTLRTVGTLDPVILIEDIDYFNVDNNSSVNMALLDVIDTRRNDRFMDNYLGIPIDLSKVFFICSVRAFEEIPEQFVPRLEIIELPGYIEREKIVIAKRYIIPKILRKHGLTKAEFRTNEKTLAFVVNNYTQEAGLLGFSQQIEKICRRIALEKAENHKNKKSWHIYDKNVETYLGTPIFIPEKPEKQPEIGNAAGLAWTGSGGELMFIEGLKMKGVGEIITTGSLGEVMRESIQAAHSYVRSKSDMLGIDFNDFTQFDVHIHFPSGAIPKDGPSAGVTVCLVIASVMSERPIRNDIAMTGEVTLRGRVLPVAGVKEKISAAFRAGIFHVALPRENEKDIKELPREIVRRTKFTFIERVDELFQLCLLNFTPSTYTLEKIFAKEVAKAKRKRRTASQRSRAAKGRRK